MKKILAILLASVAFGQVTVQGPELQISGTRISHARTDGNTHVPRSFGVPAGYQLTTHGGSGDAYWAAPGGAFVDSARAAKKADTAIYATVAGRADSSRVSGLSDSAKALVRYARIAAVHDTADSVRKYTRDRINDSLVGIRAALPAYVRRIGDTITGPITGTTATAAPMIDITTTFGNLANAAIRGTASASGGTAIHGVATGASGVGVWGVSTNTGGDGGLFSGTGGAHAVRAIATGGGKAGQFNGDVGITGGVLSITTTTDAPISISHNIAGGFTHPFQAFNSGMVAGNQYNFDFGQSASTNNAGNFGFKYVGAGSASNYVTLGLYGANDLLTITAAGVPKFSGLTASKFVKTDASKNLVSTDVAYSDLTGTVPTWNQSTTGNAATATKWATPRTLTIGATGKAIDGTGNQSWSLAEIGAQAAGTYLTPSNITGSVGQIPALTGVATIAGDPGLTRTQVSSVTNAVAIGDGSVAGAVGLVLNGAAGQYKYIGLRSGGLTSWEIASEAATHLFAISAYNLGTLIDDPLKIASVAGGAISIGGGGRPVNLTSGSKIQINGADAITSARAGDLTALKVGSATGFVRSAGGTYSASALVAADIPNLDASKITTGTLPDVRISSASTWNAKVGGSGTTGYLPTWTGAGTLGNSAILEVSSYLSSSKPMAIENLYLAKLTSSSIHWGAIYGAASTPSGTNYLFTGKDDGTESELNGATSSALSVGGTKVVTAQSSGATLAGTTTLSALAGATTRIATVSATGQIGATSWAYDGPYLPLAGGTVTGYTTFNGIYVSIPTQLLLSSTGKIRTGLLDIYSNNIVALGLTHFMGAPGFQFDDGVPLAIKSAATVAGTGGSLSFDSDAKFYPKRIHITTTTYTLPVVAVGETILLTFDVSACQLSTNSSQSVTWRTAGGTNSFAATSTTNFDSFGYGTGTRIASVWLTGVSSTRVDIRG